MTHRLLWLVLLAIVSACTSALPPAPRETATQNYRYLIGPGDELRIDVWRNAEISGTFPVRPDGMLSSPLIDEVVAVGKTPDQLARDIEKQLSRLIQNPHVSVVPLKFQGKADEQIRVIGQATKPSTLPYRQNMNLLDVMIAVGGITDFAAGNRAVLIRASEGNKQYNVRLRDLLRGGDVSANIEMRPGDIILIPQSWL